MRVSPLRRFLLAATVPVLLWGCAGSHPRIPEYQRNSAAALSNANKQLESNHLDEALHLVRIALKNHQLAGDLPDSVHDMNRIGYIKNAQGEYLKALLWFQRAALLAQIAGDPLLQAETLSLSSDTELFLKNDKQAAGSIEKGLGIIRTLPSSTPRDRIEAHLYNSYGILRLNEKRWKEALAFFQKALGINQRLKELKKQAGNWANIGNAYLALMNSQEARDAFSRALRLDQKTGYVNGIAFDSEGLALADFRLNRWQEALQSIVVAYQIRLQQKNTQQSRHDLLLFHSILTKHPLPLDSSLLLSWPSPGN